MSREEKLKLAFKILRGFSCRGNCIKERFRSEYPFLADIMEEMLVEAQAFLKMDDDEFELKLLNNMPYDSFKVLISYYAEEELKKHRTRKRVWEEDDKHLARFPSTLSH